MPRCGCQDSCSCLITAGPGVTVEGIGTLERPYEISTESDTLGTRVYFSDDGGVDFTTTGTGSTTDPLVVVGDVALVDLSDVSPSAPANGQVPVWRTDHWAWETPSGGGGSAPVSGVWGTAPLDAKYGADPLIGREIYLDSAGKIRSRPDVIPTSAGFFTGTTPIADYPPGSSVMSVSSAEGAANWPAGQSCTVVTHKRVDTLTGGQWCYLNHGVNAKAWYRNANNTLWSPWQLVVDSAADTGWVTLPVVAGFAAQAGYEPKVRKVGNRMSVKGAISNTGLSASGSHGVLTIPAAFNPGMGWYMPAGASSGAAGGAQWVWGASGDFSSVQLRLTATVGTAYYLDGNSWLTD